MIFVSLKQKFFFAMVFFPLPSNSSYFQPKKKKLSSRRAHLPPGQVAIFYWRLTLLSGKNTFFSSLFSSIYDLWHLIWISFCIAKTVKLYNETIFCPSSLHSTSINFNPRHINQFIKPRLIKQHYHPLHVASILVISCHPQMHASST